MPTPSRSGSAEAGSRVAKRAPRTSASKAKPAPTPAAPLRPPSTAEVRRCLPGWHLPALSLPAWHVTNPLTAIEPILKRDEADIVLVAGNVALVALNVIEWPFAALTLAAHLIARSRFKALQAVAEVAEEAE
jgi:hypothetical protein